MSDSVSRLLAAKASLPASSSLPLGLLLGSYDPQGAPPSGSGGAPKGGGTLHALLWAPLASLSSDPEFEEEADVLQFLQQQQQQQIVDRLIRQAALCCSHHLVAGLTVLGVWARVAAAAEQQKQQQHLQRQQQELQQQLQLSRLAAAVAEGPLKGQNAADEAAAAAALLQNPVGALGKKVPLKQPFVLVLLQQQQQQQQQQQDSVFFSSLSGGSWQQLTAASLFPAPACTASSKQQKQQQQQLQQQLQQQQQQLQLCCSPITLDLTLLLEPSLLKQEAAAALFRGSQFRAALQGALRAFAGIEGPPNEAHGGGGAPPSPPPFYCSVRKTTDSKRGPPEKACKGALCDAHVSIAAAAAAAAAAAGAAASEDDMQLLQLEFISAEPLSLQLFVRGDSSVATAAPFSVQQQQELLPHGFAAVCCQVSLEAVSINPKTQTLKTVMEFLIADWVRAATGCIGSSLEEACGEEAEPLTSVRLSSLQQRRHLMLQDASLQQQQQQTHGTAAVLCEFLDAEEQSERGRVEFLFGHEGQWGVLASLPLFSFPEGPLGPPAAGARGAPLLPLEGKEGPLAENNSYWRNLIHSVRIEKVRASTTSKSWLMLILPLIALFLSYFFEAWR